MEPTVGVNGMKPATHILHTRAEAGKRIGLEIDVTKIEQARSGRADKPAVLLRDTSVTDWALGYSRFATSSSMTSVAPPPMF